VTSRADEHPGGTKLWGGRFASGPAPAFEALNNSIGVDFRLWPYDVRLSKAWALALGGAGVITAEEQQELQVGLDAVARRLGAGESPVPGDEDVHTLIDRLLREEAPRAGPKLHTGRSRNDQVATATRLWTLDACEAIDGAIAELQRVLLDQARALGDAPMPAYTHLQRAIPVTAAHWLMSHVWPLVRDRIRVRAARAATSTLPLGSGAVAGSAYPVSRALLQEQLGFASISENSIDAVSDRDFAAEVIFACAMAATHLSRLAEDLIIYGTSEFGFVRFGDSFTSGSSMMPQKRNPDALELARGSAARVLGDLVAMLATLKGLPSSYNKDLQDDKRVLFDAVDTLLLVLSAMSGAVAECTFNRDRMRAALSSGMLATDLADYLVRKGISFRDAHGAVGKLVRMAEEAGGEIADLPASAFTDVHASFDTDVRDALSAERSLAARALPGGTAPSAVADQLSAAAAMLESLSST
jgi:argininosuccinate lyase